MKDNPIPYTLVLDASLGLQVGIFSALEWVNFIHNSEPVLEQFDALIDKTLAKEHLTLADISDFIFCEGPGSVLGIRTINVFLQAVGKLLPTSPSIRAYQSLALCAESLRRDGKRTGYLFAEYKRQSYQGIDLAEEKNQIVALTLAELNASSSPSYHLEHRAGWALPERCENISYRLSDINPALLLSVSQPATLPQVFALDPSSYQKWTPQLHRAPTT